MAPRPKIEICLSPALLHLFDTKDKNVVIIDIFRATSTIVTALANGAKSVIPVAKIDECIRISQSIENTVSAGERDGQIAPGLQYGNSPLSYPPEFISGKTLVLTTTNGTKLLHMVEEYHSILIGAFVNLEAVVQHLKNSRKDIILGCAAWKDRVNLEDTLFAGAVAYHLQDHFDIFCDSTIAASNLYQMAKDDLLLFLKNSNHYRRLSGFGLMDDLKYCTTLNLHPIVPVFKKGALVVN